MAQKVEHYEIASYGCLREWAGLLGQRAASTPFGSRPHSLFQPRANQGFHPVTFLPTCPPLARALAERNYDAPTPVQTAVLADAAVGRD